MSDIYLQVQTSNPNLHRSKWRTTCYISLVKISHKSDG